MITGSVNASFEARIQVVVQQAKGRRRTFSAVIDTGFNGFITLPPTIIASLKLVWRGRREATLADGRLELVGMALLEKSRLDMAVVSGGNVAIRPLP
jgi:predicted aspartyl protease